MLKKLLVAAMLLTPTITRAQVIKDITTADYRLQTEFFTLSPSSYRYQIRFQNLQGYDAPSATSIGRINISNLQLLGASFNLHNTTGFIGPVYTQNLPPHAGNAFVHPYDATTFTNFSGINVNFYFGGDNLFNQVGLLGCSAPVHNDGATYAGATCVAAGYTGFAYINMDFTYNQPTAFTERNLDASVLLYSPGGAAFNIITTPEPSTWLLLTFGLGMVGVVRRKRAARY